MADKHFLVHGALCKCNCGTKPDKLVVTQQKEYMNDAQGSKKAIANTKDIGTPFEGKAAAFGNCTQKNNAPCALNLQEWSHFYENITLSNGGKILTDDSKGTCSVGGQDCITVLFHGQTAEVTQAHFDEAEITTLAVLNPLAPPPQKNKEIPKVKGITVTFEKRAASKSFSSDTSKTKVAHTSARVDEPMTFTVSGYYNAKADKSMVCWRIIKAHDFSGETEAFDKLGPELKLNFDHTGKYRILALGNPAAPADVQNDERCSIDVEVKRNTLKKDFKLDKTVVKEYTKGDAKRYYTSRGQAIDLSARYEFEPATTEEKQQVNLKVVDETGNIVAFEDADQIKFTLPNSAASYRVVATMAAQPGEEEQKVEIEFETDVNSVVQVTAEPASAVVRPDTPMNFAVSKVDYGLLDTEDVFTNLTRWRLNGKLLSRCGRRLELNGEELMTEGKYVVDAFVEGERKNSGHKTDDWTFEVTKNYVTGLKTSATSWVIGKEYTVEAVLKMVYGPQDGNIRWTIDDIEKTSTGVALTTAFHEPGLHCITASLNGCEETVNITTVYAQLKRWCVVDSRGIYKSKAGWKEKLTALVVSPEAAGATIGMCILERDTVFRDNYIKYMGLVRFDAQGKAAITFNTDDLKGRLDDLMESEYDVYFGIRHQKDGIQFSGTKTITATDGNKYVIPEKASSVTNEEKGVLTLMSGTPEIMDVIYRDSQGNRIYKVMKYGDKVELFAHTKNLRGKEVTIDLYLNVALQEDVKMWTKTHSVAEDETLQLPIDTSELKKRVKDPKKTGFFYAILTEKASGADAQPENTFLPARVTDDVIREKRMDFYGQLKLSENPDKMNEMAKKNALVVLGRPMEIEENDCGGQYCIKKGDKSELIREVNIRLSGFGGNVPTDEFTDRTEKMIKQFQRDYMGVAETGKICGNVLYAIDDFASKYDFTFNDIKCRCGKCSGFGNQAFIEERQNSNKAEGNRKYEYPGVHRSLLWALRSVLFYTSVLQKNLGYTVNCIISGYRCWHDNKLHARHTTNHMGKALDLHFNFNNKRTQSIAEIENVRKEIFIKYLGAQIRWKQDNLFSLEPGIAIHKGEFIAPTWIHYDVRRFGLAFLKDVFFVKTTDALNGPKMMEFAADHNPEICSCFQKINKNDGVVMGKNKENNFTIADGKSALKIIYEKFGKETSETIEKIYRDETGHFTSNQYKKCGTGGMEAFGSAPYYGWDNSFFKDHPEFTPIGLWEAFEGKGMSGEGGNAQVLDRRKKYIIFPSVLGAMEYKVFYINNHDGNWARWHAIDPAAQEAYRKYISKVTASFTREFEK